MANLVTLRELCGRFLNAGQREETGYTEAQVSLWQRILDARV